MLLTLLVAFFGCAVFLLYLKWRKVKSFWAVRNIPHDSPHPILGSLTYMSKQNAGEWMRDIYNNFNKAPFVGIWLMWKPALVINDPEVARRVLIKDSDVFRDRNLSSGKSDPIGGLNIFTVNDPIWSSVRRRLTTVFTTAKLKLYQPLMVTKAKELCQRIGSETEQQKVIDIRDVLTDYTTDIVGTATFGVESNSTLTGDSPMRRVTRDFQTYSVYRAIAHTSIFFVPELVDIFRFSFFPKDTVTYFKKVLGQIIQERGGLEKPVTEVRDLIDALAKMKQEEADNKLFTMDLLTAQAAIMVQGGFETSAGTMTFIIYELAYNMEAQEKLYQEIIDIKKNLEGQDFNMESLQDAVYLNCVIKEILRKYPPMGYLDRIANKEYKIDDNLTIPAGVTVYINAVGMQVDPEYFPEPKKFIPERFLPENEKDIIPFTYLPFGEGPRACIGRRFAHQTIRFAIAELVSQYKFHPRPNTPKPNDCQLTKRSLFLLPGELLSVEFVPR